MLERLMSDKIDEAETKAGGLSLSLGQLALGCLTARDRRELMNESKESCAFKAAAKAARVAKNYTYSSERWLPTNLWTLELLVRPDYQEAVRLIWVTDEN